MREDCSLRGPRAGCLHGETDRTSHSCSPGDRHRQRCPAIDRNVGPVSGSLPGLICRCNGPARCSSDSECVLHLRVRHAGPESASEPRPVQLRQQRVLGVITHGRPCSTACQTRVPGGTCPSPDIHHSSPQRDQRNEALVGGLGLGGDRGSPGPSRHPVWILKRPQLKRGKPGMGEESRGRSTDAAGAAGAHGQGWPHTRGKGTGLDPLGPSNKHV